MRFRSCRHADQCRISSSSHRRTSSRCTRSALTSGTVISGSFFPQPPLLQPEEPQSQKRQGGMVVPPHPAARLILVQPALPLGRLKTLLHRPVAPPHLG